MGQGYEKRGMGQGPLEEPQPPDPRAPKALALTGEARDSDLSLPTRLELWDVRAWASSRRSGAWPIPLPLLALEWFVPPAVLCDLEERPKVIWWMGNDRLTQIHGQLWHARHPTLSGPKRVHIPPLFVFRGLSWVLFRSLWVMSNKSDVLSKVLGYRRTGGDGFLWWAETENGDKVWLSDSDAKRKEGWNALKKTVPTKREVRDLPVHDIQLFDGGGNCERRERWKDAPPEEKAEGGLRRGKRERVLARDCLAESDGEETESDGVDEEGDRNRSKKQKVGEEAEDEDYREEEEKGEEKGKDEEEKENSTETDKADQTTKKWEEKEKKEKKEEKEKKEKEEKEKKEKEEKEKKEKEKEDKDEKEKGGGEVGTVGVGSSKASVSKCHWGEQSPIRLDKEIEGKEEEEQVDLDFTNTQDREEQEEEQQEKKVKTVHGIYTEDIEHFILHSTTQYKFWSETGEEISGKGQSCWWSSPVGHKIAGALFTEETMTYNKKKIGNKLWPWPPACYGPLAVFGRTKVVAKSPKVEARELLCRRDVESEWPDQSGCQVPKKQWQMFRVPVGAINHEIEPVPIPMDQWKREYLGCLLAFLSDRSPKELRIFLSTKPRKC
eukprot:g79985.t1